MSVLKILAELGLDSSKYDKGLDDAEHKASTFGTMLSTGLKTGVAALGGAAVAGVTATAAAVTSLTKQAVGAYGEFEQLEGGIETLFGDAAPQVMEDASRAFSDAGMSINQYMETSIQSAAAMINSLEGDQAKAAELMNMSIIDMSDNVNKMGTTMEAVQNAYRGFSRGNFTMLDNLALGFAGTKKGMQELLDKAQEISGIEYDIDSYSDIVQAIHVVQQEMGITGTTMKEAGDTITGSLGAVKAAWENLITGLANEDADIGALADNLIGALFGKEGEGGFLGNMLPRVEKAIQGVAELVKVAMEKLPPLISSMLPTLITQFSDILSTVIASLSENMPVILAGAGDIISSLLTGLVNLVLTLVNQLPAIAEMAVSIMMAFANALIDALPNLLPSIVQALEAVIQVILSNLPMLVKVAGELISALLDAIVMALPDIANMMPVLTASLIAALIATLPELANTISLLSINLILSIIKAIVKSINADTYKDMWAQIIGAFTSIDWATVGHDLIFGVIDGVKASWDSLTEVFGESAGGIVDWLAPYAEQVIGFFQNIFNSIVDFFSPFVETILATWESFYNTIKPLIDAFGYLFETIFGAIKVIVERDWEFIKEHIINPLKEIYEKIKGVWDDSVAKIREALDILVPIVRDAFETLKNTIAEKLDPVLTKVKEIWDGIKEKIKGVVDDALDWGKDLVKNFVKGLTDGIPKVAEGVTKVADKIHEVLHFSEPDVGPLKDFSTYAPDMMATFAKGIADNENLVTNQIKKSFDFGGLITQATDNLDTSASITKDVETDNTGLVSALVKALREVAPDFTTNVVVDANADGIIDLMVKANAESMASTGRGVLA